jgi:hypothetical protein
MHTFLLHFRLDHGHILWIGCIARDFRKELYFSAVYKLCGWKLSIKHLVLSVYLTAFVYGNWYEDFAGFSIP